jgi:hypothetical protein
MKYVRTKKNIIKITTNAGHHTKTGVKASEVKSAGRFKITKGGKVKTYSKSFGFEKWPQRGDARLIKRSIDGK